MNSKTTQRYINFYFEVHQPNRLRRFLFFDIGSSSTYFDEPFNKEIVSRVASNCYLPTNAMLLKLIRRYPGIRLTFSLSGIVMEQMKKYAPKALESFRQLAETGAVEFLGETYYHSLASLFDADEFSFQVEKHRRAIKENFNCDVTTFRNTEFIYSDEIGEWVSALGFKGMYIEGVETLLRGRPVNKIYMHPGHLLLFPRNYRLSDDISFRFADKTWAEWPLSPATFMGWLEQMPAGQSFTSLGMDYETFGEHQKATGGIVRFMEQLMTELCRHKRIRFINPAEADGLVDPSGTISAQNHISWADKERDLSAWLGNEMQKDAFESLKRLYWQIQKSHDSHLLQKHRYLQTSDHFYYMSTKKGSDGEVHRYFSPYSSPYEAFMNYMNVLSDLALRTRNLTLKSAVEFVSG